jgi:excisionase family DNA binding protein
MITIPDRPYLKIKEAAGYFGVCDRTIRRWAEKGKLLEIRVGGSTRINRDSVIRLEAEGIHKNFFKDK